MALIAVDLDGTLLNSNGRVSEGNAEAIRKAVACGHTVVPATARWYQAAIQQFERIGLKVGAIAAAGADVRLADGSVVAQRFIAESMAGEIAAVCDRPGRIATLTTPGITYRRQDERPSWADNAPEWLRAVTHLRDADLSQLLAVLLEFPPGDPASDVVEKWRPQLSVHHAIPHRGEFMLTITAPGADKGSAVEVMRQALGLGREDVVVFGDSDVDLTMFEVAGTAVAMANGERAVRERASFVTAGNDEDGVAVALAKLGLVG